MKKFLTMFLIAGVTQLSAQTPADSVALRQQRTLDSLTQALGAMASRLDSLANARPAPPSRPATGAYMNASFVGLTDFAWSTERDLQALQLGDHDPRVRGFSIPNGELVLEGAVDPYFKGVTNIVYKLDENGETGVELEEMYFLTSSLPHNLQLKGGQFFTEFGRQNAQHPHAWGFGDQTLVNARMFGGEGLRSQGVRLSWLAPTRWYTEAMLTVANSAGGTASSFRWEESADIHGGGALERDVVRPGDLLLVPRLTTSFDLTNTQTIMIGASGAFGPNNSGTKARTSIYGGDVYWKWKSARAHRGFPFVSVQAEAMARRYGTDDRASAESPAVLLPEETLHDRGIYAQALWGIRPMLVLGVRAEAVHGDDGSVITPLRGNRSRWSSDLTLYPTEFSKLRLQYNYDRRPTIGNDHSVLLQFEFLLGAHAAHKF